MAKAPYIDREECISCGVCVEDCPEVFRMAKDDRSEVYNPTGADEASIQTAIDDCPVACIHWKES